MKTRELLQIELWSKRTTRKILVGLGIVYLGVVAWFAVDRYWLTPGERSAGRAALVQIDELQNFGSDGIEDFAVRARQAKEKLEAAQQAAWTMRDKAVATGLTAYLSLTLIDQEMQRRQSIQPRHAFQTPADDAIAQGIVSSGKKASLSIRLELHNALD